MVALHTSNQDDILICLQRGQLCPKQDRVGELVGTLVDHFTRIRKVQFPVKVCCPAVQLHMRGKVKNVTVQTKPEQIHLDFKKSKDGFVLLVPANQPIRTQAEV
ncbi:hypothetical protein fugu_018457 [Takifugu bimaculatus]|uniref:TH1 domain-containing protein n=1 Tax=Takifugu bimaculatus TaxID=433685 RepID=A0A4Z2BL82_9TELE|nr:hypothetical protein fugu_018457 [Takifugu bimaculatus]